ncbi:MAG: hypothetical protein JXR42_04320 [Gammaproteobacteria bacterium]|nr:hypothetical protein [Gammaproteobacteria bacterium]
MKNNYQVIIIAILFGILLVSVLPMLFIGLAVIALVGLIGSLRYRYYCKKCTPAASEKIKGEVIEGEFKREK